MRNRTEKCLRGKKIVLKKILGRVIPSDDV